MTKKPIVIGQTSNYSFIFKSSKQINLARTVIIDDNGTEVLITGRYGEDIIGDELTVTIEEFNNHAEYTDKGWKVDEEYYFDKNFRIIL